MAQNAFEKTMKNVDLGDKKKDTRRAREKIVTQVEVEPTDKSVIWNVMKEELNYFNALVGHFGGRIKAFPEHILSIEDRWFQIYQLVAEIGYDLTRLYSIKKPDAPLPEQLEPFRDILLNVNKWGRVTPNERMVLLLAPAGTPANILPSVRRTMATEILRFYQEQARVAMAPVGKPQEGEEENIYRAAPETLLPVTLEQKKHIQLTRESVKVNWDEANDCSWMKIPYAAKAIKVPRVNLVEEDFWNHVLLHQEPRSGGTLPNSPWVVELQHLNHSKYLIKYLDSKRTSAGRVFSQAKARQY